jgi:hypothetical protein
MYVFIAWECGEFASRKMKGARDFYCDKHIPSMIIYM